MTMSEGCGHYMDMVRDKGEERFHEARADAAYNLQLLKEQWQAEEQLGDDKAIASNMYVAKHTTLLESYRSARKIRLNRWWYRHCRTKLEAAYKLFEAATRCGPKE
ncbi:hypothetical protein D1007_05883 [Hordeum vulgare]|nr:hypothetical protein D1007_05883 [Hordeum vulgare]